MAGSTLTDVRNPLRLPSKAYADALAAHVELTAAHAAVRPQLASPFTPTPSHLQAVVWADLVGADFAPLDRAHAIGLPPIARQRHLICGTTARSPLVVLERDTPLPEQPRWATRTDGSVSPYHRMLWTADDVLFYGWSCWRATRGAGTESPLLTVERIPYSRWEEDEAGRIRIDGEYPSADEVILIPGPHEGILNMAPGAIRMALENAQSASNAARNPSAYLELHYTGDEDLPDEKIDAYIARWAAARRGENGGVAWTNKVIEVREHGTHESHLLIEGRNADAVDMSRLVSSPAAMADATSAGASLTYETTQGRNGQFLDYGVSLYMDAIAARLSMDDVVPRGKRTGFDTSSIQALTPAATGHPTED